MSAKALRNKIIDSLNIQGFAVNGHVEPSHFNKETFRKLHEFSKNEQINLQRNFIEESYETVCKYLVKGNEINPSEIKLEFRIIEDGSEEHKIFRWWNLVWWSVPYQRAYGRQMRFLLWDKTHNAPFGLIGLQSPILKMAVRDNYLKIPAESLDLWVNRSMQAQRLGAILELNGKQYKLEGIEGEGKKSVVFKAFNEFGIPVAIKFATHEDYKDRSYLSEISLANKLYEYQEFAKFHDAVPISFENGTIKCIAFIEEWIGGVEIKNVKNITPTFIKSYITQFCQILNILRIKNLRHDDLNLGNVKIINPPPGYLKQELLVRVIDMGSLKEFSEPLKPIKNGFDDLKMFCTHLALLTNKMMVCEGKRSPSNKISRGYRQVIIRIINSILETDPAITLNDPQQILNLFANGFDEIENYETNKQEVKLIDPFDYISAEHIDNDNLLLELFAQSCPWLKEVSANKPLLLTGPRGCGKSMLFRWLSLKSLLLKGKKEVSESSYAAFYISCSSELRNRFGLFDNAPSVAQAREEIIHYFNLLLCREIISTLVLMSNKEDRKKPIFGLSENIEKDIFTYLINELNIPDRRLYLQGVKPLEYIHEVIIHEMNYSYKEMLKRNKLTTFTSLSFLADFTKFLKVKVPYFYERKITFLLDDYSIHRISEDVQKVLNAILWDRQATHIFKISCEKFGMTPVIETNSRTESVTDLGRELTEVDIGELYILQGEKDGNKSLKKFTSELLNHRLNLAKYKGTTETLIGKSKYEEHGTLAKAIRNKQRYLYYGIETITKTCSGDISTLLEIYRTILRNANVKPNTVSQVAYSTQHDAITSVSGRFIDFISDYRPHGDKMYAIVISFGNMCNRYLTDGPMQLDTRTNIAFPNDTTRIEVEELDKPAIWEDWQNDLIKEMVRRSIFIHLRPSRGYHTGGKTLRLQLRKIYAPHCKTGLGKNIAIKMSNSDFHHFITSPKQFCEEYLRKPQKNSNSVNIRRRNYKKGDDTGKLKLFDEWT